MADGLECKFWVRDPQGASRDERRGQGGQFVRQSFGRRMNGSRELVRRLLPVGPFARSVSILAGGTALSQGLAVLAAPVLTRLYSVEDFGYFQMYVSVLGFAILAVTLRYELAIMLPEREETAASLLALTLCTVGAMSTLFASVAWWAHDSLVLPASAGRLRPYLWLVPVSSCGAGVYQAVSYWALRQKAYSRVAGTRLTQVVSQLGVQTVAGFLHSGPFGLLLGDAIGRMNGSLSLARLSWSDSGNVFRSVRWRTMLAAAVRYRRFPLVSNVSALLGVAAYSVPAILIAQLYGPKSLGWFALGDRVLGVPTILIGQAVSQVYSVNASSLSNSDPKALHTLFLRSIKHLALLGVAPFLILFFFSPLFFGFVFGESWREAGIYARMLALMHYVGFITWPLMPTINILEEQYCQLAWEVGRLALTSGCLWIAHHWGSSARGAIGAFCAAMTLSYMFHLLMSHYAITRRVRDFRIKSTSQFSVPPQFAELGKP
jgi:O-antigen/teichoic acid export membrane protein